MAFVLSGKIERINDLPENLTLYIFSYLSVKEICAVGRVCRSWRRIANDNSLWRHVDLRPYKLSVQKIWKVIRAHFSEILKSLHVRGYMDPAGKNWNKNSLSDAMMRDLQERCPNIQCLELIMMNLTPVSAEYLPSKLEELSIKSSLMPPGWLYAAVDKQSLKKLNFIDLSYSTKTCSQDLKDISLLSRLEVIKLNGCYRVTEEGLKILAGNVHDVRTLEISETSCTDLALHHICRGMTKLARLDLSRCQRLTAGGIASISTCLPCLEWLSVKGCKVVTDEVLCQLQNLKKISYINLQETKVTEVGVSSFRNKHNLCEVELELL